MKKAHSIQGVERNLKYDSTETYSATLDPWKHINHEKDETCKILCVHYSNKNSAMNVKVTER